MNEPSGRARVAGSGVTSGMMRRRRNDGGGDDDADVGVVVQLPKWTSLGTVIATATTILYSIIVE